MPEIIDVVEALLFASDTPVEASRIQEVLDLESPAVAREPDPIEEESSPQPSPLPDAESGSAEHGESLNA